MLRASELAAKLNLTPGRISQLVGGGKLDGCFSGEGARRRFDLDKCVAALGRNLSPGQMLGNGAGTRRVIRALAQPDLTQDSEPQDLPRPKGDVLSPNDPDRYEMARTAKAEEDLRSMRLRNGREEGMYVLASEVERQVTRLLGQEMRETETFLRDAARAVADKMGVDFRTVRQTMVDAWRAHRQGRANSLELAAESVDLADAEKAAQI